MEIKEITKNLTAFAKLERVLAGICIMIPLLLVWADHWNFRESISNYVYMPKSYIYGLLLAVAAMLFIVNGVIYLKTEHLKQNKQHGKWYNIILGVALFGIVLFPHQEYTLIHYFFAAIFFGGSAFVIAFFNDEQHRKISIFIAGLSILSLLVYIANSYFFTIPGTGWLTLFLAEWISLAVISVHYILESTGELT